MSIDEVNNDDWSLDSLFCGFLSGNIEEGSLFNLVGSLEIDGTVDIGVC